MNDNFKILTKKLDAFIRRYYVNRLLKGLILSILFLSVYFLTIFTLEYFSYYSTSVRTFLFILSICFISSILLYFIVIPFIKIYGITKVISYKDASLIIARFFPDIKDKLTNTLELEEQFKKSESDLLLASISQRIDQLKTKPFISAINFKANLTYVKYMIVPFIIGIIIFLFQPDFYKESAVRLINYKKHYEKETPFSFFTKYRKKLLKGEDLQIELQLTGDFIPENVMINIGDENFYMSRSKSTYFNYTISSVNSDIEFSFSAGKYSSPSYYVEVIPPPIILDFEIDIIPPQHTSLNAYSQKSIGDLSIPEGSLVTWKFQTTDVSDLYFVIDSVETKSKKDENVFSISKRMYKTCFYNIHLQNNYFSDTSFIKYSISVQKDAYPKIAVNKLTDTVNMFLNHFKIKINDDYGIRDCRAHIKLDDSTYNYSIPFSSTSLSQEIYYSIDLSQYKDYDSVRYYFSVTDNDAINGYKTSKSTEYFYTVPSVKEMNEIQDSLQNNISNTVNKSFQIAEELKRDIDNLKRKILDDNLNDWERQSLIKDLSNKHKELSEVKKDIANEFEKINKLNDEMSEQDQALMEKQKQIEDLLESIMDDEFKELLEELNKLSEQFDKNKFFDLSEDIKMSYEDFEKQLDKNLEMLKRFEVETKINKTINDLKDLSKKQMDLSNELENLNNDNKDKLQEKLKNQEKKFDDITEQYKDALEKNKNLSDSYNLEDFEKEINDIKNEMQDTKENISNNKSNKSSKGSKKNSEEMQKLANSMQEMMNSNSLQQALENIDDLRQILDNLITYSFDQERLLNQTKSLLHQDPRYLSLANDQVNLKDNFKIIEDSLYALASRIPQINNTITKELSDGKKNIIKSFENLEQLNRTGSKVSQQYTITAVNNLALLLDEILQQMQQSASQMQQKQGGKSQCNNPNSSGQGMPSLSQMKNSQESMKKQMQQMIDQMKKNGGKPGGKNGMSKQLSQMLSQQEMYNKMLNEMMNKGSFTSETMQKLNEIKRMMDKNENDIINRKVSESTLFRQNQIVTRLLESEQAERKRELDKKRESKENKEELISNTKSYFKYDKSSEQIDNIIEYSNIKLNKFYKKKYDNYIIFLNNNR